MARPSNEGTDRAYSGVITAILSKPLAFKLHGAERPQSVGCDNKARRDQMGHDQAMSGTDSAAYDGVGGRLALLGAQVASGTY